MLGVSIELTEAGGSAVYLQPFFRMSSFSQGKMMQGGVGFTEGKETARANFMEVPNGNDVHDAVELLFLGYTFSQAVVGQKKSHQYNVPLTHYNVNKNGRWQHNPISQRLKFAQQGNKTTTKRKFWGRLEDLNLAYTTTSLCKV